MNQADKNIENLFNNLQAEAKLKRPSDFVLVPQISGPPPALLQEADSVIAQVNTREELLTLAESGKIKYTANYIKKASNASLDKIKVDYERKQLDETNDYVANNILSSIAKLLKYFDLVKNTNDLEEDLQNNDLLKRDVKNIVGVVTPSIPYIGLLCGGVTVGKHVAMNALNEPSFADAITPARPNISSAVPAPHLIENDQ